MPAPTDRACAARRPTAAPYTPATVADLPIDLTPELAARLARALDVEGKIVAALEALGPVVGCDVALVDTRGGPIRAGLVAAGARVEDLPLDPATWSAFPSGGFDAVVGLWSAFRGINPAELAGAERLLRPGGRLLVFHDYGRDDIAGLRGDLPEYGAWSRRNGPFLAGGFRVRVLHCFWTFETLEETRAFLADAFGEAGVALGETLKRPRLSWNVGAYHRARLLPSDA